MSKVISFSQAQEKTGQQETPLYQVCEVALSRQVALNRLCTSLIAPENQKRFMAFPESYCRNYGLTLEQIHAVTDLDVLRLLKLGGTVPNLEILVGLYSLDLVDLCCQQTGKSPGEVRKLLR